MRLLTILTLAIIGVASGMHVNKSKYHEEILKIKSNETGDRFLDDILLNVLESIRKLMKNGSESIPVLDPLRIEKLLIDEDLIGIPGIFLKLVDTSVENLSTFVIDSLDVEMESFLAQRYRVQFEGHIDEINAKAENYDVDVKVNDIAIKGDGSAKLKVTQPRLKGSIVVTLSMNNGIFLTLLNVDLGLSLKTFEPEITGLFGNEISSQFVSSFLRSLVPELMTAYQSEINQVLSETVLTLGNTFLQDFDLGSLLNP